ncbi:Adenine-specific DNA methylase, contains a Zn-ribbon domain [Catalinimonas alkaloidigena]|uniref:Adenine-specific DNA methylase, contains a Zn-ribbon domain n=1 Tax=Catalinimonas alkaloidigena TaxID=1075417 RepID=A0A1G9VJ92_9BACT|nr:DUF1156 domain-containing protein [Catalinimonas alkaloidigena]SDM71875.1 Adenine-specific DNA methylase, contains a Zn-ribbon domain [Catalinimonas alkaloidigena]
MPSLQDTRLIETGFPLKETSLDSVHEKNVRHGHISTLHIWPARRPLAACRAALLTTLLRDPIDSERRTELLRKIGGTLKDDPDQPGKQVTQGGVLHWGNESSPVMDELREAIREVYPFEPPKVMDPFCGGGATMLEAMRLGCDVTAADLNPVAWFILKCTLEYPQRIGKERRKLPEFAHQLPHFLVDYRKAIKTSGAGAQTNIFEEQPVALDWHVRLWGHWVLEQTRADLAAFYPTVNGQTTVAYLWARTVTCKNCRATLPLLKTRWLCKKENKRVLLTMEPHQDRTGVTFGIDENVPKKGKGAKLREHDKKLGAGTISRAGAQCPCCGQIMPSEDLREAGKTGKMGQMMTAVVIEETSKKKGGRKPGKAYRLPTQDDLSVAEKAADHLTELYADIPFGLPDEPTPKSGGGASRAFSVDGFGLDQWHKLFTSRQLLTLGALVKYTRAVPVAMKKEGYADHWIEAIVSYLALGVDRQVDRLSALCRWDMGYTKIANTLTRFALPIVWDFAEGNPFSNSTGSYLSNLEWIARYIAHSLDATKQSSKSSIRNVNAISTTEENTADIVLTDPPYYDAIPYSALMDFFYVWLRRTIYGLSPEIDEAFKEPLAPKWDHNRNEGELIDDAARFEGNKEVSKKAYEDGMARAFEACHRALKDDGRLVIVFAHKKADAWETLVSAIIRAGFVVDASWPIQTEMGNRTRAQASAALSSSIWLVCRKRTELRPGWDNKVLKEMDEKIPERLRRFYNDGIQGPDFLWAAIGPALEAYSAYPFVKKANEPGAVMTVREFLQHARQRVVDFAVGAVVEKSNDGKAVDTAALDEISAYYILHRWSFGHEEVPVGVCIQFATSCGLDDRQLTVGYDLLAPGKARKKATTDEDDDGAEDEPLEADDKNTLRLKTWSQRSRDSLGYEAPGGRPVPLIDQVHRLLKLFRKGEVAKVDDFVREHGLRQHPRFGDYLQAVIELAKNQSEEHSLLSSLQNHMKRQGEQRAGKSTSNQLSIKA